MKNHFKTCPHIMELMFDQNLEHTTHTRPEVDGATPVPEEGLVEDPTNC